MKPQHRKSIGEDVAPGFQVRLRCEIDRIGGQCLTGSGKDQDSSRCEDTVRAMEDGSFSYSIWSSFLPSGSRWNWHQLATAVSSIAITRPTLVDTPAHDLSRNREGQPQRDGKCDRDDQQQII